MYAFFSYHTDSDPHIILLQLKKNYLQVHKLQNQSGFGWDDGLKMVTASDEVWATYLKVRVHTLLVKIATNNFIGKSQGFSLAQDTIPSVRRYPFPCPWCCCNRGRGFSYRITATASISFSFPLMLTITILVSVSVRVH